MKKLILISTILSLYAFMIFPITGSAELNQYKYFYRGKRFYDLGEYDKAIHDFTRAIQLENRYVFAYAERGRTWEKKGFHEKALSDFNKALKINPQYTIAYKYRGLTWQAMGEYARALDDFKKALEIDPGDSDAFYLIGSLYCMQHDKEDALKFLKKALENGFHDFKSIENNPVWDNMKNSSEFKELLLKYKQSASLQYSFS